MNILGNGIYSFSEASALTGLSVRRVRAWFEGWNMGGTPRGRGRVFRGDYPADRAISFFDLIEVKVAGRLRERGISLIALRKAHAALVDLLDTPHPFSRREIYTDGKAMFVRAATTGDLIEIVRRQHVIPQVLLPYLERVDYDPHTRLAAQWRISDGVVIDPRRHFGKPIVQSSSMPTALLAQAYQANGRDLEAVADWYGVTPGEVEAAARFESGRLRKAA
jgi:uncharacterized protein (DUF433 family)